MILFAALVALIVAFCIGLKLAAEFGDRPAARHLKLLRDSTPPHEYTNLDGTKGRWP